MEWLGYLLDRSVCRQISLYIHRRPSKNCSVRVATGVKNAWGRTGGRKNSRVFLNLPGKSGAGGDANKIDLF